jgi:hypothetical protein
MGEGIMELEGLRCGFLGHKLNALRALYPPPSTLYPLFRMR